jgi:acyl carrier protein
MSTLMLDDDLEKWIIKLIVDVTGINPDRISLESCLNHDLGIDGDDAAELLSEYAAAFGVDMSGFHFSKYFQGEPHLFNWWVPGPIAKLSPVTVRDLVEAARQKKWRGDGGRRDYGGIGS